jgi:hypothetical protein
VSHYSVEPSDKPKALTTQTIKALRHEEVQGISRRRLLRTTIGAGFALWLLEVTAGTLGFLWPNLEGGFGGKIRVGTLKSLIDADAGNAFVDAMAAATAAVAAAPVTVPVCSEGESKQQAPPVTDEDEALGGELKKKPTGRLPPIK